jgi:hypothetical protein
LMRSRPSSGRLTHSRHPNLSSSGFCRCSDTNESYTGLDFLPPNTSRMSICRFDCRSG